jgi:hypothetical protein
MRRFLYFVLQLYVAVILTLLLSDYFVTNQRIEQFRKMEDCCSTFTEQYRSFVAVAQSASRLSSRASIQGLTRIEKYRALSSWEAALHSSIRGSSSLVWDQPGRNAASRLTRYLGNRNITESDVSALVEKYREAADDFDPTLTDDEEKTAAYLLKNLSYLNAVTDVAGGQLRELLAKEAGSTQELEIYVVAQEALRSDRDSAPGCSSLGSIEGASSLGRKEAIDSASQGFLSCVRGAVHHRLSEMVGLNG